MSVVVREEGLPAYKWQAQYIRHIFAPHTPHSLTTQTELLQKYWFVGGQNREKSGRRIQTLPQCSGQQAVLTQRRLFTQGHRILAACIIRRDDHDDGGSRLV